MTRAKLGTIAGVPVNVPHRIVPNAPIEHVAPGCDDECHGYRISGYPCRCSCHVIGPW